MKACSVCYIWGYWGFFPNWLVWFKCCYFFSVLWRSFFKSIIAVIKRVFTAKKPLICRILACVYNLPLKNNCLSHHHHCRLSYFDGFEKVWFLVCQWFFMIWESSFLSWSHIIWKCCLLIFECRAAILHLQGEDECFFKWYFSNQCKK